MKLSLSQDQTLLRDAFSKILVNESSRERVQAAFKNGFDPELWRSLTEAGLHLVRVPEDRDGLGESLMSALILAEEAGTHLASAPVAEAMVATRLIALSDTADAAELTAKVLAGEWMATLAGRPTDKHPVQMVNGASVADVVLAYDGQELVALVQEERPEKVETLGMTPAARLDFRTMRGMSRIVLAEGEAALALFQAGVRELKLLNAGVISGMARQSLADASEYSRERHAFDRPIGSYQGLAHPLADAVTDVDGAMQLSRLAIWSIATGAKDAGVLTDLCFWWAGRAGDMASLRAMRVFGGYGVSLEYAAHIFHRRIRALYLLDGDPEEALLHACDALAGKGDTGALPDAGEIHIDMGYRDEALAFAEEAREFFRKNLTPELEEFSYRTGDGAHPELTTKLYQAGYWFCDWPKEYGGGGRSPQEASLLASVYGEFDWWMTVPNTNDMVGKIIQQFGSEELKRELLPKVFTGEVVFCLGYSEPSTGSDVFAAKTTAVKSGDGWLINGQKMFTSQGHVATHALMITRTDPNLPKHAGITLFIAPLDQKGFSVTEVETYGSERTNVTFYTDVYTPDGYRLGEVNGGAKVLAAALLLEHSGGDFFLIPLRRVYRDFLAWAKTANEFGDTPIERDDVRKAVARLYAQIGVLDALNRRSLASSEEGARQKHFGPMTKLFGSEAVVSSTTEVIRLAAPDSLLEANTPLGRILLEARRSVAATIYAGTSEIQRSIIAETALSMPRTRS